MPSITNRIYGYFRSTPPSSPASQPKSTDSKVGAFFRRIARAFRSTPAKPKAIQNPSLCNRQFVVVERVTKGANKELSIVRDRKTRIPYACLDAPYGEKDMIRGELHIYDVLKQAEFKKYLPIHAKEEYEDQYEMPRVRLIFPLCKTNLAKEIENKSLEPEEQNRIFREAGFAICDFLDLGLIHRDIKPSNFLIRENQIFLTDFDTSGIEGYVGEERFTFFHGTEAYAAPETRKQIEINNKGDILATQGEKADIYAFGLTALELYGKLNIKNLPKDQTVDAAVACAIKKLPRTPEFDLIKRMLEREPANRPDRQQVREELDRIRNYRSFLLKYPGDKITIEEFEEYRTWISNHPNTPISYLEFRQSRGYLQLYPTSSMREFREDQSWHSSTSSDEERPFSPFHIENLS